MKYLGIKVLDTSSVVGQGLLIKPMTNIDEALIVAVANNSKGTSISSTF